MYVYLRGYWGYLHALVIEARSFRCRAAVGGICELPDAVLEPGNWTLEEQHGLLTSWLSLQVNWCQPFSLWWAVISNVVQRALPNVLFLRWPCTPFSRRQQEVSFWGRGLIASFAVRSFFSLFLAGDQVFTEGFLLLLPVSLFHLKQKA